MVRDQNVYLSEVGQHSVDDGLNLLRIAHVRDQPQRRLAELLQQLDGLLELVQRSHRILDRRRSRGDVADDDRRSCCRHGQRVRPALSPGAPGNQGHPSV
jgi:hypothetical protein